MKKVFVLSLLLMSIFFIGNVAVEAFNGNCKWYSTTITTDCIGSWEDCIEVCLYEDGYAEAWHDCEWTDHLEFTLEDLGTDAKNLVGFSTDWPKTCHVYLRGRILEADCLLDMFEGCRIHAKGVVDNNCECQKEF